MIAKYPKNTFCGWRFLDLHPAQSGRSKLLAPQLLTRSHRLGAEASWEQLGTQFDADHLVELVGNVNFPNENWRRRPDLNRGWRFCRPLPYHLATAPLNCAKRIAFDSEVGLPCAKVRLAGGGTKLSRMERETGFEPATSTLARSHSTTELFPLATKGDRTTAVPGVAMGGI